MALQGTIKDFGLPDIFQLIGLQRKTGILTLINDKDKESVTVTFENGMVVMADSSQRRLEDRLGNVLVKQGKLSRERLDDALATQKQTLQRLGHVLASNEYITPKDLKDALQVQVSQIVFKVFRWRDGEYHFAPTDSVDYDRENTTPMSADFILMEGIRMVDEWPIIEKRIPSFDMVFRPVVDPSMIEVGEGGGPDASGIEQRIATGTGKIRLAAEEERVFRRVDGVRTVQAIIDSTGTGEFEVCRTLFDFLNRNLITAAGQGRAARAADAQEVVEAEGSPALGYGLAALVAVLALVGVLVHAGSPFAVTGLGNVMPGTYDGLREDAMRSRLMRLERGIEAWRATYGRPPSSLDELVQAGLVPAAYLVDPWSRPVRYETDAAGYVLTAGDGSGASGPGATIDRRGGR